MTRLSDSNPVRGPLAGLMLAVLWAGAAWAISSAGPALAQSEVTSATGTERAPAAAAMDEIVVRVLQNAEVSGDTFTLGEIAEFDGFDVEGSATLAKVSLGRSPSPGRPMLLSEMLIRSRLAGLTQADRVRLIVPKNAQVMRASQTVRAQELEEIVRAKALKDEGGDPNAVRQEVLTPLTDLQFPKGEIDWQVELLGKHLIPGGDRTYQVTARVGGREVWRMPVRLRQKVYQTVVVAKRPIRRDQIIAAEDVTTMRRTMNASLDAGYTGSLKTIVGKKAKRPIAEDEPISDEIVRTPAAVNEGGRVTVVYETPVLLMQVPGVALVSGQVGQFIPVRNLDTGRIVYGVIQPNDRVKVN